VVIAAKRCEGARAPILSPAAVVRWKAYGNNESALPGIQVERKRLDMSVKIQEVPSSEAPIDLLLLADPSEEKIRSYLETSRCFTLSRDGAVLGACVVRPTREGAHELMSIAVWTQAQKSGWGTALLKWVIDFHRQRGVARMVVGTGTFGYQLAFYQRQGFRVTSIERDFFLDNYPDPIFEEGIQLFDMLVLTLELGSST